MYEKSRLAARLRKVRCRLKGLLDHSPSAVSDGNDNVDNKLFTLGGQSKSSNANARFFDEEIAEVMIFDYVTCPQETPASVLGYKKPGF